jgi:hypothetical protein
MAMSRQQLAKHRTPQALVSYADASSPVAFYYSITGSGRADCQCFCLPIYCSPSLTLFLFLPLLLLLSPSCTNPSTNPPSSTQLRAHLDLLQQQQRQQPDTGPRTTLAPGTTLITVVHSVPISQSVPVAQRTPRFWGRLQFALDDDRSEFPLNEPDPPNSESSSSTKAENLETFLSWEFGRNLDKKRRESRLRGRGHNVG